MNCSRCESPGIFVPVLLLHKKKNDPPLRVNLENVKQCAAHKSSSGVNDFLSNEGWDKIKKHLREMGRGRFVQRLTTLTWYEDAAARRKAETHFRSGPILEANVQFQGEDECLPF